MTTEMWRVVMTYGDVVDVDVTRVTDGPVGDWLARFLDGEGYGESPRSAVLDLCASNRFGAEEILAPGELSAEERVADERVRCAAVCRARAEKHRKTAAEETAAAEYGEALESGVTAREADACAEAIERGAVER